MTRHPGRPPEIVAIEGVSGIGKTTVARSLARELCGRFVAEAFRRLDPAPSLRFWNRRELERIELALADEEGRRFAEATDVRARGTPVVLDTATLGPLTYAWGVRAERGSRWDVVGPVRARLAHLLHRGWWGVPDRIFYLDAPVEAVAVRRDSDPEGHPAEYRERHARVGAHERGLWLGRLARQLPRRVQRMDASGPADHVSRTLARRLDRSNVAATSLDAARVLRGFRATPRARRVVAKGNR